MMRNAARSGLSRSILAGGAAAVLALATVAGVAAQEVYVDTDVKLRPKAPVPVTTGSEVIARANFRGPLESATTACFHFTFTGDLLDPGDVLILELEPTLGGFGFGNGTATPQASRTICTEQPADLGVFLDGRQTFTITMVSGSVTIGSLSAEIFGS